MKGYVYVVVSVYIYKRRIKVVFVVWFICLLGIREDRSVKLEGLEMMFKFIILIVID